MVLMCAADVGIAVDSILAHAKILNDFVRKTEFSSQNVASMLRGNRGQIGNMIIELNNHIKGLNEFVKNSAFAPSNVSSMLGGSKGSLCGAIESLIEHKELQTHLS